MIYTKDHADMVVDGRKSQTRRIYDAGRHVLIYEGDRIVAVYLKDKNGRLRELYRVGKTYACCPGRGVHSVGRSPKLESIRLERLMEISQKDAQAEGVEALAWETTNSLGHVFRYSSYVFAFKDLWDSINSARAKRWKANPQVLALTFEPVEGGTDGD